MRRYYLKKFQTQCLYRVQILYKVCPNIVKNSQLDCLVYCEPLYRITVSNLKNINDKLLSPLSPSWDPQITVSSTIVLLFSISPKTCGSRHRQKQNSLAKPPCSNNIPIESQTELVNVLLHHRHAVEAVPYIQH